MQQLPGLHLAEVGAGLEELGEEEGVGEDAIVEHVEEHGNHLVPLLFPGAAVDHGGPGEEILLTHFGEHLAGIVELTAFCVHADQLRLDEARGVADQREFPVEAPAVV